MGRARDLPGPTLQASTSISGLAALTVTYFRFRALTKMGETDWSEPVSLLVR